MKKSIYKQAGKAWIMLLVPIVFLVVFMLYPLTKIILLSFKDDTGFTGTYFMEVFTNATYYKVILITLKTALIVTFVSLVMAYPVAYVMTICKKRTANMIMLFVMIPFWTSFLVRTYSWMALLQTNGIINQFLMSIKVIAEPLQLMYNSFGVTVGMVHVMIPYMVLSLYSVMESIDSNYVLAAQNLGSGAFRTFFEVYFPMSVPGVASGSVLVFVLSIGFYITPSLLGGTQNTMIAQLIQTQVSKLINWNLASAIAVVVLVITLVIIITVKKVFKLEKIF